MPFRSEAQRRWMHAKHPAMAERWEAETSKGKKLPRHVSKRAANVVERIRRRNAVHNVKLRRLDPTMSQTLRRQMDQHLQRQFATLKGRIVRFVGHGDALGLVENRVVPSTVIPSLYQPFVCNGQLGWFPARRLLDLPDVRQDDKESCGAAAAMSVGRFFGIGPETLEGWKELLGTDGDGTSPKAMVTALRSLGLQLDVEHDMPVDWLGEEAWREHPILCPIQSYGGGHWIVVVGASDGWVFLQDPADASRLGRVMVSKDDFVEAWHDTDADGNEYRKFGIMVEGLAERGFHRGAFGPVDEGRVLANAEGRTLAVDFDGRIGDSRGDDRLEDVRPRPGAREALERFRAWGLEVVVWTARKDWRDVPAWLDRHGIPYDDVNPQDEASPKINADMYLDDRGEGDPDAPWPELVELVRKRLLTSNAASVRQPTDSKRELYALAPRAQEELRELLSRIAPVHGIAELDVGGVERLLAGTGPPVCLLAPIKDEERAAEKVERDYGGDWSKLLDLVRGSAAFDTLEQLRAAVLPGAVREKDRFAEPLPSGYRDYLTNYRLPCGLICEVQYHLKPMLAAREKQHVAYSVVRTIRSNMGSRRRMTEAEKAACRQVKSYGRQLLAKAWEECKERDPTLNAWSDAAREAALLARQAHGAVKAFQARLGSTASEYLDRVPGGKFVREGLAKLKAKMEARYGKAAVGRIVAGANVISWAAFGVSGGHVYLPVSALTLAGAGLAELHLQGTRFASRLTGNSAEAEELYQATLELARRALVSNDDRVARFAEWVRQQSHDLLTAPTEEELWRRYTEAGFRKGAGRSFDQVRKRPNTATDESERGAREEFLRSSFAQPESVEKVKSLAGQAFEYLKGVTEDMVTGIRGALADGLTQGQGPAAVARAMADKVDGIGLRRARMIARTEMTRAHASGQLASLKSLGVDKVGVEVEFSTAGDEAVCEECAGLEGTEYTLDDAEGVIPVHPNCRCAFVPSVK